MEMPIPGYILGINRGLVTPETEMVRRVVEKEGGMTVNSVTSKTREENLGKAEFGMGILDDLDRQDRFDLGHLVSQHKPVVLFRGNFSHPTTLDGDEYKSYVTFVSYRNNDLQELIEEQFSKIREGLNFDMNSKLYDVSPLHYDGLEVDFQANIVRVDGRQPTHLSPTELEVLKCLARFRGCILTHNEIIDSVWGSKDASLDDLKQYVSYVNRRIGVLGDREYIIRNRQRLGYYVPLGEGKVVDPYIARVLTLIRKVYGGGPTGLNLQSSELTNGKVRIDFLQMLVFVEDKPLDLGPKEFKFLSLLAMNRGTVVPNQKLADYLRAENEQREVNVKVVASRCKIKVDEIEPGISSSYLISKRGLGRMMPNYEVA